MATQYCTYETVSLYGWVFVEALDSFGITQILSCLYLSTTVL